jgi:hypothetical protein
MAQTTGRNDIVPANRWGAQPVRDGKYPIHGGALVKRSR